MLGRLLGRGNNTHVKVGTKGGERRAVKYMRVPQREERRRHWVRVVNSERHIMAQLSHPNILHVHEGSTEGELLAETGERVPVLYIVFDLMPRGSLLGLLGHSKGLSDGAARFYFKRILEAIEYLHGAGFAHRDLKLANVLVDEDFEPRLGDFGSACPLVAPDGGHKLEDVVGTRGYMAPEMSAHKPYDGVKADLFSLGVVLLALVLGTAPFHDDVLTDAQYKRFCDDNPRFWAELAKNRLNPFLASFQTVINGLLALDPNDRTSTAEVKETVWYKAPSATAKEVQAEFAQLELDSATRRANDGSVLAAPKPPLQANRCGFAPHLVYKA